MSHVNFVENSFFAFIFSCVFVLVSMPFFIKSAHRWQGQGQPVRALGPKTHKLKEGTPTLGGLVLHAAVVLATLLFCPFTFYTFFMLATWLFFGTIGFLDDWAKLIKHSHQGIGWRMRLFLEFAFAFVLIALLVLHRRSEHIIAPLGILLPLGHLILPLGFFFIVFGGVVLVGSANAVNLTDGLDGLASWTSLVTIIGFGVVIAFLTLGNADPVFPHDIMPVGIFLMGVAGALVGFLFFNQFPASVFMGDTGSLAVGAALGITSLIVRQEILWIILGGVFVAEAISVIIQLSSYRLRKRRLLLMAPLHHHFEQMGFAETKVMGSFVLVSLILLVIFVFSWHLGQGQI